MLLVWSRKSQQLSCDAVSCTDLQNGIAGVLKQVKMTCIGCNSNCSFQTAYKPDTTHSSEAWRRVCTAQQWHPTLTLSCTIPSFGWAMQSTLQLDGDAVETWPWAAFQIRYFIFIFSTYCNCPYKVHTVVCSVHRIGTYYFTITLHLELWPSCSYSIAAHIVASHMHVVLPLECIICLCSLCGSVNVMCQID